MSNYQLWLAFAAILALLCIGQKDKSNKSVFTFFSMLCLIVAGFVA